MNDRGRSLHRRVSGAFIESLQPDFARFFILVFSPCPVSISFSGEGEKRRQEIGLSGWAALVTYPRVWASLQHHPQLSELGAERGEPTEWVSVRSGPFGDCRS